MSAKRPVYSTHQSSSRRQSIELCTRQTSAKAVAKKQAVSRPTLYEWKNQLPGPEVSATMKLNNDAPPDSGRAELERQVESLRHDLQLLGNQEKTQLVDALKHT